MKTIGGILFSVALVLLVLHGVMLLLYGSGYMQAQETPSLSSFGCILLLEALFLSIGSLLYNSGRKKENKKEKKKILEANENLFRHNIWLVDLLTGLFIHIREFEIPEEKRDQLAECFIEIVRAVSWSNIGVNCAYLLVRMRRVNAVAEELKNPLGEQERKRLERLQGEINCLIEGNPFAREGHASGK
ncbi:MAG: hypothetical protein WC619_03260 [Patescibacteria group bacterium]